MSSHEWIRRAFCVAGAVVMSLASGYVFVAAPLHAQAERALADVRSTWSANAPRQRPAASTVTPTRAQTRVVIERS